MKKKPSVVLGRQSTEVTQIKLVDVRGLEPLTPCLQIQKTNLETEKKDEKE